jgi:hypothetical protein
MQMNYNSNSNNRQYDNPSNFNNMANNPYPHGGGGGTNPLGMVIFLY